MFPDLPSSLNDLKDTKLWDRTGPDYQERLALKQPHPFLCYAAEHWWSHFLSQEDTVINQSLKNARALCDGRQAWVWVAPPELTPRGGCDFQNMTDLSLAGYLGLKQVIENMISEEDFDVNIGDESSGSALSAACSAGQSDVVMLLLKKGANCNSNCGQYGMALHAALRSVTTTLFLSSSRMAPTSTTKVGVLCQRFP
jgi:hypothetical protein